VISVKIVTPSTQVVGYACELIPYLLHIWLLFFFFLLGDSLLKNPGCFVVSNRIEMKFGTTARQSTDGVGFAI